MFKWQNGYHLEIVRVDLIKSHGFLWLITCLDCLGVQAQGVTGWHHWTHIWQLWSVYKQSPTNPGGGGVLPMWWVIHMCRGFDPLFSLWQDRARSFWGIFSHPPTPKRSFVVLKLPILTEFDLLGPKFHFSLDFFWVQFSAASGTPPSFFGPSTPPGQQMEVEDTSITMWFKFMVYTSRRIQKIRSFVFNCWLRSKSWSSWCQVSIW